MMVLRNFFFISILFLALPAYLVGSFSLSKNFPPAPKPLKSIPLPLKLAGGLFLFQSSVKPNDKAISGEVLNLAERTLRADPLISMELGAGLESGGIFASSSVKNEEGGVAVHQIRMEFQLNGGNSWAQAKVHGIKYGSKPVQLISLGVSNMDAALNGGWAEVTVPLIKSESTDDSG
eukprot:102994_1